jgi:hypothetical protein
MVTEKFKKIFNEYYRGQFEELDNAFKVLKENGASMADCVKVLIFELKLPLKIADELVVNSKTWGNSKADVIELRKNFHLFLKKELGEDNK